MAQRTWTNTGRKPVEIPYVDGAGVEAVLIVDPGHEITTDDETPIGQQICAITDPARAMKEA